MNSNTITVTTETTESNVGKNYTTRYENNREDQIHHDLETVRSEEVYRRD